MRKSFTILLLFIFLVGQYGYYCYSAYEIHKAKEAAHQQLLKQVPENLLDKISLDGNNAIQWEEEGKEFRLNGKMYDIAKAIIENGKVYFLCLADEKEDLALSVMANAVSADYNRCPGSGNQYTSLKITMSDWVFETTAISSGRKAVSRVLSNEYFVYKSAICSRHIKINYPPPNSII